jgi:hypothetical protein
MDRVFWSTVAEAMVPSYDTIRERKYITTAGRVKFATGEFGSILFNAPIVHGLPRRRYTLRAHLERDEVTVPGLSVKLRSAGRVRGNISDVMTCTTLLPNVDGGIEHKILLFDSPEVETSINLQDAFYWVQVRLEQALPFRADTVYAVLGVSLLTDSSVPEYGGGGTAGPEA